MKKLIRKIIARILVSLCGDLGEYASILMYHSVGDTKAFFTVSPKIFRKQIAYLAQKKYRFVTMSELLDLLDTGQSIKNTIGITFDDGYTDVFNNALPILQEYGAKATVFVPGLMIGKDLANSQGISLSIMNKQELQKLTASGVFEIMSHTRNHIEAPRLSEAECIEEIEGGRKDIEDITHSSANIFAYVRGRYDDQTIAFLKERKWRGAVTVEKGLIDRTTNRFMMPRNPIDAATSFIEFRLAVSLGMKWYAICKRFL